MLCNGATSLSDARNSDIEEIWQLSWRTSFYRGGPVFMSALSGIDIALWDLKGMDEVDPVGLEPKPNFNTARKLGVPIYQLLGGKVRNKIQVYAWIGGDDPKDVEKHA
jgi:galactonate dehydratase